MVADYRLLASFHASARPERSAANHSSRPRQCHSGQEIVHSTMLAPKKYSQKETIYECLVKYNNNKNIENQIQFFDTNKQLGMYLIHITMTVESGQ